MEINLGKKSGNGMVTEAKNSSEMYYPNLYIETKPDGCKVGDTIEATVKLKLKSESHSISDTGKNSSCSFDVISIDFEKEEDDD